MRSTACSVVHFPSNTGGSDIHDTECRAMSFHSDTADILQVFETMEPVFDKRPELLPVMVCSLP